MNILATVSVFLDIPLLSCYLTFYFQRTYIICMDTMSFTWDPQKNLMNQRKHDGIDFEEAKTVFYDEYARVIFDPQHSHQEDRFIILGLSSTLRILVVCHCYRESESLIRIISARKASKKEEQSYERQRNA